MKIIDKLKQQLLCNPKIKMIALNFPQGTCNTALLSDILEENPPEKYYLSAEATKKILNEPGGGKPKEQVIAVQHPTSLVGGKQAGDGFAKDGISYTLRAQGSQHGIAIPVLTPDRLEKRQQGRRFKTDGEPSFTLNCQDKHGISDGVRIRRLTPLECTRLQGFPDGWMDYGNYDGEVKEISDTQKYKVCGNAVTVKVVEEVLKSVIPF